MIYKKLSFIGHIVSGIDKTIECGTDEQYSTIKLTEKLNAARIQEAMVMIDSYRMRLGLPVLLTLFGGEPISVAATELVVDGKEFSLILKVNCDFNIVLVEQLRTSILEADYYACRDNKHLCIHIRR